MTGGLNRPTGPDSFALPLWHADLFLVQDVRFRARRPLRQTVSRAWNNDSPVQKPRFFKNRASQTPI